MHMKLSRRCPACRARLDFAEEKDGVYVLCMRCRLSVYMPAEAAAEYANDFPTLIEIMTMELTDTAKRRDKQKGGVRRRSG